MEREKRGLILRHPTFPPSLNLYKIYASGLIPNCPKRLCIMLVCELIDACISVCMVTKSSIHRPSYPIPSIEFSQTIVLKMRGSSSSIPTFSSKFTSYTWVWPNSHWQRDSYISISSVLWMEMSSPSIAIGTSSCARYKIDPPVLCGEGTKDEDHVESCDPSLEHQLEPQLDELDENARFTPPINFFILHSTSNNNTQQQVPSTLGVSISVSQMGGRKQWVV
jgi:hypothetical protein